MALGIFWTSAAKAAMPAMCGDISRARASLTRVLVVLVMVMVMVMVMVLLYAAASRAPSPCLYHLLWWVHNLSRLNLASVTSIVRRN
jgi:hypothetical protein